MGVDFSDCPACGEWFCDAGPYFYCESCGTSICDSCAEQYQSGKYSTEPIPVDEEGEPYEDDRGCPFCDLRIIHTHALLNFALKQLGCTQKELEDQFRKSVTNE